MSGNRLADHLNRLLSLIPYFLANDGIELAQAADDLGISVDDLVADLEQLSMSGLPGKYQDQMIDFYHEDGRAHLSFVHGDMKRPLRLNSAEATMLLMALRALTETHAIEREVVERAIAKVESAAGGASAAQSVTPQADSGSYDEIRRAVRDRKALSIRYYTASRDSISDRVVDPVATQVVDGYSYLSAWCRRSGGMRLFRFDRIDAATVLDEPARPPVDAPGQVPSAVLSENTDLPTVDLAVDKTARWVFEYYSPIRQTGDADENGVTPATLRYGSEDWLVRFLLGFGGRIRVLSGGDEPAGAVAERVRLTAAAVRARYA